jgi:cyclomaltodextrinase / maltogenic alpha-amylase / neopullulanase
MFNSRNPIHRYPTGAVPNCMPVHFKITMPRDIRCSGARLVVKNDATGAEQTLGMFWCGMNGDHYEWWECHFSAKDPGLYFYWFNVDTWRGTLKMTRGFGGEGTVQGGSGHVWQLTVYDRSFVTPNWLEGGIIYQIFPDRFYRSNQGKSGVPKDRKLHENWSDQPDWAPDDQGKITNTDYFGGDLRGIEEKLDYLKSLGVTCIYLNPIFESHSNHRYDTADYSKIDPLLGNEEDFSRSCKTAKKMGIRIILDGVFSHTGSDSVYFNRQKRYAAEGAYNSQSSPYYPWYTFRNWPDDYDCWWNFVTLPNVNEVNPQYNTYINGRGGIIQKWIALGAGGWRLDVADELPDQFIDNLRVAAKSKSNEALILGEVWEDASNKTAYGYRRKYLLGGQLDSVMNYPFRNAILGFLTGSNAADMMEIIMDVIENYPPQVTRLLMNHIGTHDTERALTILAGEPLRGHGRSWQSTAHLTKTHRHHGLNLMRLASLMQFTLPGVPCIYYGDEAGVEGYRDPFNRSCYPWGNEENDLIQWYQRLGKLRASCSALKQGEFAPIVAGDGCIAYLRKDENSSLLCALNAGGERKSISVPAEWQRAEAVIGVLPNENNLLCLEPEDCAALLLKPERPQAADIKEEPEKLPAK